MPLWISLTALVIVLVLNAWTFINLATSRFYLRQVRRIRLGLPAELKPWYVRLWERLP